MALIVSATPTSASSWPLTRQSMPSAAAGFGARLNESLMVGCSLRRRDRWHAIHHHLHHGLHHVHALFHHALARCHIGRFARR
ncbi:MAG: hypothetical protein KDH18_07910, partial [Rhodoferax sp.]|nr:hypothetical protein [Rhodoferax sp.]